MPRRFLAAFFAALLFASVSACAEQPTKYSALPTDLLVKMENSKVKQKNGSYIDVYSPSTVNPAVNDDLSAIVQQYIDQIAPTLPPGKKAPKESKLYIRCVYSPTGESWLSFMILARTVYHRQQLETRLTTRTYDIASGKRILMTDLFPADSPAWAMLSKAVEEQLTAYFPEVPDSVVLQSLCAREALEKAEFTLGAVKLELQYPASVLYPGRTGIMHVKMYYRDVRGLMTDEAARQTDNSRYPMAALTFDDGPRYVGTVDLLDSLQAFGAKATFFLIGDQMDENRDVVQREQDEGHTVASHTWNHYNPQNLKTEKLFAAKEQFDLLLMDITGQKAPFMRAPGGRYQEFVRAGIGIPVIQWSVIGGDISTKSFSRLKASVAASACPGGIVLLHDSMHATVTAMRGILYLLQKRGFLCVSVDDLFVQYGQEMLPNTVYRDANGWVEEVAMLD